MAAGDHLQLMILSTTKLRKLLSRNKALFLDIFQINLSSEYEGL